MQAAARHQSDALHTGSELGSQASQEEARRRLRFERDVLACAGAAATGVGAPARLQLRHPRPQHDSHPPTETHSKHHQQQPCTATSDHELQWPVVGLLLRELDAARRQGAAAQVELAALKNDYIAVLRGSKQGNVPVVAIGRDSVTANASSRGLMEAAAGRHGHTAEVGARTSGLIKAFRPAGPAPPPKLQQARQHVPSGAARVAGHTKAAAAHEGQAAEEDLRLRAVQQDNAEMRVHLAALYAHCRYLQGQLEKSPAPNEAAASPQRQHVRPTSVAVSAAAGVPGDLLGSSSRTCSPGRTTVLVASPPARDGAAGLAVAVFEPPPGDAAELCLALNRMQRQNLKLTSKVSKAKDESADRAAEARRWQEMVEQQAGAIAELRVEAEGERRKRAGLEQALEAAQEEQTALLAQLQAAEAAGAATEGEASSLRCRLAALDGQLARALAEADHLKEEAVSTSARLSATDLVRREAERERDDLELHAQRLQAALAEAQTSGSTAEEELVAQVALAQQQVAVERQRSSALAAQLALAESSGRENERLLTEQLRAVQGERDACLAAATRADALLVKLGQHALVTRGAGQ